MAHGRAIIASDLPVLREVLGDRVNSLLCPPYDCAAWEEAVAELAGPPSGGQTRRLKT
jgi:glycosyltransferase involved in cell wall biosynthesis